MNKMCTPVPHPEIPEDHADNLFKTSSNFEALIKGEGLGFSWLRNSRLCPLYHMSVMGIIKFTLFKLYYNNVFMEKLELPSSGGKCK